MDGAVLLVTRPPERSLRLDTRAGNEIPNQIWAEPDAEEREKIAEWQQDVKGTTWEERKPMTSGYNCAGHVWASRRTVIIAGEADTKIRMILEDDGYRLLPPAEGAREGDLVLYWNEATGGTRTWLHVGVVTDLRDLHRAADDLPCIAVGRIPWVLSKWNHCSGEWLHRYNDVPYPTDGLVIEFWTDRPQGG
jgi:hypothetical protein